MPGSTAKRACTGPAPESQGDIFNRAVTLLNEFMFDDAHWPAVSALLEGAYEARNSGLLVGEGLEGNVRIHFAGAILTKVSLSSQTDLVRLLLTITGLATNCC